MRVLACLAVMLPVVGSSHEPQDINDSSLRPQDLVDSAIVHLPLVHYRDLSGKWQLAWDDAVNAQLDDEAKLCTIDFRDFDGRITGQFVGPVAGTVRDAMILGQFAGTGSTRILSFEQREAGYVCSYQAIDSGGEIVGVWHDTRGASGDFRLLKHQ